MIGEIELIIKDLDYGLIKVKGKAKKVTFNAKCLKDTTLDFLYPGQYVEFDMVYSENNLSAINVRVSK